MQNYSTPTLLPSLKLLNPDTRARFVNGLVPLTAHPTYNSTIYLYRNELVVHIGGRGAQSWIWECILI